MAITSPKYGVKLYSINQPINQSWPLRSEGSLVYHTNCDTWHPFVLVISRNSHLLTSTFASGAAIPVLTICVCRDQEWNHDLSHARQTLYQMTHRACLYSNVNRYNIVNTFALLNANASFVDSLSLWSQAFKQTLWEASWLKRISWVFFQIYGNALFQSR